MKKIEWGRVKLEGYLALVEAAQELEQGQREQELRMMDLEATLTPLERMETWWFRRYVELYGMLIEAGMPPDAEGGEVARWLRERAPAGGDARGGNGNGWREVVAELGGGWRVERREVEDG